MYGYCVCSSQIYNRRDPMGNINETLASVELDAFYGRRKYRPALPINL